MKNDIELKKDKTESDISVESNISIKSSIKKITENNVDIHTVVLKWDKDAADDKAYVCIRLTLPIRCSKFRWTPQNSFNRSMVSTWMEPASFNTMLAMHSPVVCAYDADDLNEYTIAFGEVKRNVKICSGYRENGCAFEFCAQLSLSEFGTLNQYMVKIRVDKNRVHIGRTLDNVRSWWEDIHSVVPMKVPDTAKLPMYSTWYSYHQDISDKTIEAEAAEAAALGMKSIIVDDGWQLDTCEGKYGHTGDWNAAETKIKNFKEHVSRVHDIGLKYVLWFSVPFVGYFSDLWQKVCDKILYKDDSINAAVLDPRYPEIRKIIIDKYKKFALEYGIDGFKLDFIDTFYCETIPPKTDGMDFEFVFDAVEKLMTDIKEAISELNPDVLVEFRQTYTGPIIRKFGNMLRVGDCARDGITNRVHIADIRMLSGNTAVHSDMIIFGNDESVEDAAWQILNSIFGVIQYSVKLGELSAEHMKMSRFWIDFSAKNRKILLDSEFIAHKPHENYPITEAYDSKERIIAVYSEKRVIHIDERKTSIINAAPDDELYLRSSTDRDAVITVFDCMGNRISSEKTRLSVGVNIISVPKCGLAVIE